MSSSKVYRGPRTSGPRSLSASSSTVQQPCQSGKRGGRATSPSPATRTAGFGALAQSFSLPPGGSGRTVRRILLRLCAASGTPYAQGISYRVRAREDLQGVLTNPVDPFFYEWNGRLDAFALDHQIRALLKANSGLVIPGINREEKAYDKWKKAESRCRITNQLFRERWEGRTCANPRVEAAISAARQKISDVLGEFGECDDAYLVQHCRHGPGGDTQLRKSASCGPKKWAVPGEITPSAQSVYDDLFGESFVSDYAHHANQVWLSRLDFVPKNAEIDRAIEVGPRWNLFLQLGLGSLLEARLEDRTVLTLKDQGRNQDLARRAYREDLATLDLASASDSVSTNLVIDLLADCDPRWLDLLLATRVPHIRFKPKTYPGLEEIHRVEKIAGMGNGYTFPLETLIFYALWYGVVSTSGTSSHAYADLKSRAAGHWKVGIFGDDIICHRTHAWQLVEVLEYCGFEVNTSKSFITGSFFESCGKDYVRGVNVRPALLKEEPVRLTSLYSWHNNLVRIGRNETSFLDPVYADCAGYVLALIPENLRRFGDSSLGDTVLHAPLDVSCPQPTGEITGFGLGYRWKTLEETWPEKRYGSYYGLLRDKLAPLEREAQSYVPRHIRPDRIASYNNIPDREEGETMLRGGQAITYGPVDDWSGYERVLTACTS